MPAYPGPRFRVPGQVLFNEKSAIFAWCRGLPVPKCGQRRDLGACPLWEGVAEGCPLWVRRGGAVRVIRVEVECALLHELIETRVSVAE